MYFPYAIIIRLLQVPYLNTFITVYYYVVYVVNQAVGRLSLTCAKLQKKTSANFQP